MVLANVLIDPSGPTVLAYTPNGRKLITAGTNNVLRIYTTGSDEEPINIDDCQDNNMAIAASVCTENSPRIIIAILM